MGKLVSIDLSDEEFEASMRRFEEEKRWKKRTLRSISCG